MKNKICVYAICKNEIKFIERWYNSVKEADYVCVLDTGSSDGSFEKLKKLGIITQQIKYANFRFDVARNDSLKLIPPDTTICVCVDLDEFFIPGWSKILKENWKPDTTQARYRYTWNFNPNGTEDTVFMAEKIHSLNNFIWVNPVHEVLSFKGNTNNIINLPQIQLNHKADNTKSRSSYLPLLELAVKENPENDRNIHYLGREYYFYKQYNKAISTLKKHLQCKSAIWKDERCTSLRYIAKCYFALGKIKKQEKYLLLAILENNNLREPYFELGEFYYNNKKYLKAIFAFEEMLKIKNREINYISLSICWSGLVYDYLAICYYELKDYKKAILNTEIALTYKNDERLKNNLKIYKQLLSTELRIK